MQSQTLSTCADPHIFGGMGVPRPSVISFPSENNVWNFQGGSKFHRPIGSVHEVVLSCKYQ